MKLQHGISSKMVGCYIAWCYVAIEWEVLWNVPDIQSIRCSGLRRKAIELVGHHTCLSAWVASLPCSEALAWLVRSFDNRLDDLLRLAQEWRMARAANHDVATGYFLGKHGLQLDRDGRVVCAFQVDAGHVFPGLLRRLRMVMMGRMMFEPLRPLLSLRVGEVAVDCLSRCLDPNIITLGRLPCQRVREPVNGKQLTLYSYHGAGGATSPTDIQGAVM